MLAGPGAVALLFVDSAQIVVAADESQGSILRSQCRRLGVLPTLSDLSGLPALETARAS